MITVTLTGSDGFTGDVTLAAAAVDAADKPLTGWTVTLDKTSLSVPTNGTATAIATLKLASDSKALTGSAKITATTAVPRATGTLIAHSNVTADNQVSFAITMNNGQCQYPGTGGAANAMKV